MHLNHDTDAPAAEAVTFDDFLRVDIRIGTIVEAEPFPEARKPAFKLKIDFGPAIGVKKSSAQIVDRYAIEELPGRQIAAVVNFPPRQIGTFIDRKSVVSGKSVSVRVDLGGRRILKKKKNYTIYHKKL